MKEMEDYVKTLGIIIWEEETVDDEDMEGVWEDVGEL